ncbi:olfactory receptor 6C74-like [Bombina bombina]|uniref:olfactory receptor 6C74-like n=1 Tax=Bombina bombina TaxID=8345 RepID=UPI00235B2022|nr:olfactory receptor 6C74-like [Bombina bombina]
MENTNHTMVIYFIIKGISDIPELQIPIFLLVLLIFVITIGGNVTIFLLVCLDPQLHTPMYFFLGNLSIIDISSISLTLHKILVAFATGDKTIGFLNCVIQMYIFSCLGSNELLILTAMSYDRYVAICKPLHYHMVMSPKVCVLLASACWVIGFGELLPYIILVSHFSCYTSNIINHFFCDLVPLVKLSCSDTRVFQLVMITEGLVLIGLAPFLLTFISYVFIIVSIMKIRCNVGRRKAFYTCSSHLTVVSLLYLTLFWQYQRPTSTDALASNKLFSLFNTAAVPMLNPLIYSLKNKDVKSALRRRRKFFEMLFEIK